MSATTDAGVAKPLARDRGVRGDDAVEAEPHDELADAHDLVVVEVGGDLHEQRRRAGDGAHGLEQRRERVELLQAAQSGRVRRTHVDDEVVGVRVRAAARCARSRPTASSTAVTRLLPMLTPSTGPMRAARQPRETPGSGIRTAVVEAHAIDERAIADQSEQSRLLVAGLRDAR